MLIVHVASIVLQDNSGMGRIACEWKKAFEQSGHRFIHIGLNELPGQVHPLLTGLYFRKYLKKAKLRPDLIIAHEPIAGCLYFKQIPLIVVSHGIEERGWHNNIKYGIPQGGRKHKPIPLSIRFFSNSYGFKMAKLILVSNQQDADYLVANKKIERKNIHIFQNGYHAFASNKQSTGVHFLFNGTWIVRKGIELLVAVFNTLDPLANFSLTIAGTGFAESDILCFFNENIRHKIKVIQSFTTAEEPVIYQNSTVFLMLSYFEGQSLALTQAMAQGLCPIVSNNCGQIDFVMHQKNGLVFKTGDQEDLKKNIQLLLESPELITEYGNRAKQTVGHLRWETVANDVVKKCEQSVK